MRLRRRFITGPISPNPLPPAPPTLEELHADDLKNGWTLAGIEAYRRERAKAFDVVPGFVVTPLGAPRKAPIRVERAWTFDPHTWGR